jgi:Protein of unknown function (DUF3109)
MYIIGNVIIPPELPTMTFSCRLKTCRGACCVVGDAGAPLEQEEIVRIESRLEMVLPLLSPAARECITEYGIAGRDQYNHWHTTCLAPKSACVFSLTENGIVRCALESLTPLNSPDTLRPISCRLFPLRIRAGAQFSVLDYEQWEECGPSWKSDVFLIDYCRDALAARFGTSWMEELDSLVAKKRTQFKR